MIEIHNKYELDQEVYYITKAKTSNDKKIVPWIVKEESFKILCIYFKQGINGVPGIQYNIGKYGKVKEDNVIHSYQLALDECKRRNKILEERYGKE